jgi:hypothetical protein
MSSIADRINAIEKRLLIIEKELNIESPSIEIRNKSKSIKEEPTPEMTINGFTKDQLRIMFSWVKGVSLEQLSKSDFEELKRWQMLSDFYPNAPMNYEEINKNK